MSKAVIGYHAVEELLRSKRRIEGELYIEHGAKRAAKLKELAARAGVRCLSVSREELHRAAGPEARHEAFIPAGSTQERSGAYSSLSEFIATIESKQSAEALVLGLDGVTDPHNLGAVLRSAEQFGADLVLVPERRSAQLNQTVAKTSAGAAAYVSVLSAPNLSRALGELKRAGFWVYGAEAGGQPLNSCVFHAKTVIVLGSEGKGMGKVVRESCDELVSIPMLGRLDSLNVSVACGILCYEVRRSQGRLG